jgi:hypothetical protein
MDILKKQELFDLFLKIATEILEAEYHPREIFKFCAESYLIVVCQSLNFSSENYQEISDHMEGLNDVWLEAARQEMLLIGEKNEQNNVCN